MLYVGTEHPRKNLPALFRAFRELVETSDAVLVKVGRARHPQREELERLAASLGIRERVLFVDHVDEDDLPLLYGTADVTVLPSLHEGFGLPPLEAMACGTPVAVSRVSSLPEVVGDAGVYFDPREESTIADALLRLLDDPELREELRARGLAHAAQFPWERTVAGVVASYDKAVARLAGVSQGNGPARNESPG